MSCNIFYLFLLFRNNLFDYNCICTANYVGQKCSLDKNLNVEIYKNFQLFYNPIMKLNEENYILLAVDKFPTDNITIRLEIINIHNYAIQSVTFSTKNVDGIFAKNNDLQRVAQRWGIKEWEKISVSYAVWYAVVPIKCVVLERSWFFVTISRVLADGSIKYFDNKYQYETHVDSDTFCQTKVTAECKWRV